ncbi:MAG: IS200/IS605 family transposase [Moorea sp. SIO1G6]|uniref:IS200/IS605 family transposase n=1 Tax=Moorena producens (strain JHB) TaxID=1454205 RepID=A0A1D9G1B6_MOOP1|nr:MULTISPECIES: IS200/IS605 family transposase [Moorena]AOY81413.1 IS200/IS605 family transposase [Moorena producens JHB]NES83607.1 IS200/IS605 family transposase [Moorena sp. SIO2B7]NET62956.1 IS200/IS605 family transposase [Moorena sp. SIO1G6]
MVKGNYTRENRSVYRLTAHIVLVTKYRRKTITEPILIRLQQICADTCIKWECNLIEFNGEFDHVHLLVDLNPKVAPVKLIANIKTVTSRLIRQEFPEHLKQFYGDKKVFWTGSYFVASCGGVTIEHLKSYVQNQKTPSGNSPPANMRGYNGRPLACLSWIAG